MIKRIKSLPPGLILLAGMVVAAFAVNAVFNAWWELETGASETEAPSVAVESLYGLDLVGCEDDVCVYIVDGDYMTKCYLGVDQLNWIKGNRFAMVCP